MIAMARLRQTPEDRDLGFREEVLREFAFLIEDYSFNLKEAQDTFVRYESPLVFVNVYHGRSSFEIKFEVGLMGPLHKEEQYYPDDFAKRAGRSEGLCQASTKEGVRVCVARLAKLLKETGATVLRGNRFALEELRAVQTKSSDELMRGWELADARHEAEAAWREKNYARVIELFHPLREHLAASELRKLEYAKKRVSR